MIGWLFKKGGDLSRSDKIAMAEKIAADAKAQRQEAMLRLDEALGEIFPIQKAETDD